MRIVATVVTLVAVLVLNAAAEESRLTPATDTTRHPPEAWAKSPPSANSTGTAVWRSDVSTTPKYNTWSGIAFGIAANTADVGAWRIITGADAPTRDEKILVGVDEGNVITGLMWDGSSWSALPFNPMATVSESFWWGFAVAYEQQSGDAVIVWNNGSSDAQCISYRVWDYSSWSSEDSITVPLPGEPKHMRLAAHPHSDEMVLVVSNAMSHDYALVWDGSSWGNSQTLDPIGVGDDRTDVYAAYEQVSGRALITYGKGITNVFYQVWNGSAWSGEGFIAKPGDADGYPRWTTLASNPNSDHILLGVLTTNQDIWLCAWDNSSWEAPLTATNSATGSTFPAVAVAFEGLSARGIATYGEADSVRYRTWMDGMGWSGELTAADLGTGPNSMILDAAPGSDHIMLSVQDAGSALNYVLWDGASWGTPSEQETNTTEVKNQPFVFLWESEGPSTDPTNYYVSPSGNDLADGLTEETAWLSIDNGDQLGILDPGDTVNILTGLYLVSNSISLTSSGTRLSPIVYTGQEGGIARIRSVGGVGAAINMDGDNVVLKTVDVNADPITTLTGIQISGDSCTISGCVVQEMYEDGIRVSGSGNLIIRNIIYLCDGNGISNTDSGLHNCYYGNSLWNNGSDGLLIGGMASDNRIFNNIVAENAGSGICGPAENVCGYNDVWNNPGGDYVSGVADSAGGISADPLFADSAAHDFRLLRGSPAIDAGLDLGYPYKGEAPDIGAIESDYPDSVVYIVVAPDSATVTEGATGQFNAYGYSVDSVFVEDLTDSVLWSTSDPSGSVSSSGLYTAGHDLSPPDYHVVATYNALADSGVVTVVTDGTLSYIRVELESGAPFSDTTLTTDNDTTRLYCRDYDSGDNLIGDLAVMWSLVGVDSIGTVDAGPATYTRLRVSGVGAGQVVATYTVGMADTTGIITSVAGRPASIVIAPDTATTPAGSLTQFATSTFDSDGNPSVPVTIDAWDVLGGIGTVSGTGLFTATTVGTGRVACTGEGLIDTTGAITVTAGELSEIEITPDSVEVTEGSITVFAAGGVDPYGNPADLGNLTWDVIGGIGEISAFGEFTAGTPGSGRIVVASSVGGITDTNRVVIVLPSALDMILVTPDTATVRITDAVQFTASGFDENFEPVGVGGLTWDVLGGIGQIDSSGMFVATATGVGYIAATSSIGGIADTTGMIVVGLPTVSQVPLGNMFVHARESRCPVLAFAISNAFDGPEQLEGVTLRNGSRGSGSAQQVLSNIDSVGFYVDSNTNGRLDPTDTFIAGTGAVSSTVSLSFAPITIGPGARRTFFIAVTVTQFPCDGDSLDMFLLPASDIGMSGGTQVAGPDTVNSLGYSIVDGLIADQLTMTPTGNNTLTSGEGLSNVLVLDVPRNGYSNDVLEIFSVFNAGTADTTDLDSLLLYVDEGNGVWNGAGEDIFLGGLSFTGNQWELSGLSAALTEQVSRFYLGARVSESAANGATLAFGIPLHGLEMASESDGPIDRVVNPVETITIASSELVLVSAPAIETREVIPGASTGPITAVEFTNRYGASVHLDSIRFTHLAYDPDGATQEQLDSQIDSIRLWLNLDGAYDAHGAADSLIAPASMHNGAVVFATSGLTLPSGSITGLVVECVLDRLRSKNGNVVNFALVEGSDVYFTEPAVLSGSFPLQSAEGFPVNAFPASNVTVHPVAARTVFGGETDQLVFDFELPGNGYAEDELQSLRIINSGSSNEQNALAAVSLWAVSGGTGLSGGDILLGEFERDVDGWVISDLMFPLTGIGNRLLVKVDVATGDFEGGTLRFEIPVQGARYESGTDGPDDQPVGNPESHVLFPANRITVIPIPREPSTVYPGSVRTPVLTFALYNGYVYQTHVLEAIRLSNRSRSVSTDAFADYELGQVSLYYDQNTNRTFDDDLLLASGYFTNGRLNLNGLALSLPPESLSYFFVAANLPLDVIDSDTLDVTIDEHSDFTFGQTVNINGDLPLSRGGTLTIDGSIARQYGTAPYMARTLSPGDSSVVFFAFRPAHNGDQPDVLDSVILGNDGDADTSDIASLTLWFDGNGDEIWQATDSLLGQADYAGGSWAFDGVGLEIDGIVSALFITGDVTLRATPNSAFRPVIPLNGCGYHSGNDGPIDVRLGGEQTFVVSTSGLELTYDPLRPRFSIGQQVEINVHVTNILPTPMYDVDCEITPLGDTEIVSLDSSSVGRASLAPGGTADFKACYTAVQAGTIYWQIQAFSSSPADSSAPVETEPVLVQTAPTSVTVALISSIPTAVTRGQTQVFPLSIKYRHSDPSPLAASVRLDSLRVRIEDGAGTPQHASVVFSRMVLATGYTNLAILESLPSESSVLLVFSQPTVLSPGDEQVLSLQVDIDSLAEASSFALTIEDADDIRFTDDNTSLPVAVDPAVEFPLRTASCRINNPSEHIALSCVPGASEYANYGQQNVDVVQIVLRHPGSPDDSQVQLTGLSFEFVDGSQNPMIPSDLFNGIRLVRRQTVVGELSGPGASHTLATMWLTAPPVISPGQTDTLKLEASIKPQSAHSAFELVIRDSTLFMLRDLGSGAMVRARSDTGAAVPDGVFPIRSGLTQLKYPAVPPALCTTSKLAGSVIAGSDSVGLVEVSLDYRAAYDRSSICLESVRLAVLDTLERALDPHRLFDRIGFSTTGGPASYESSIELDQGCVVFHLGPEGVVIEPGGNAAVELLADMESDTEFDHFILRLYREGGLSIVDVTDAAHHPGFVDAPGCSGILPFTTDVTTILLPAGAPTVRVSSLATEIAFPGQTGLTFFTAELTYSSSSHQGDLVMKRWRGRILRRTPRGLEPVSGDQVFQRVSLLSDTQPVAVDSSFTADSLLLDLEDEYVLPSGSVRMISLACDIKPDAELGNYVIEFADSTFAEFEDRDLSTTVYPDLAGGDYPAFTAEISVTPGSLASSFSNWPNPFNPDCEVTTIGFVLEEDAHVDIEIFTITGELVKTIATGVHSPAGAHNDHIWTGLNNSGYTVIPGTYFCRVTARYSSGRIEDVKRKVAVIR